MQSTNFYSPGSIVTVVILILLTVIYYFVKNRNILPGPMGIPYFGIYPFLRHGTCHLQLEEYGKKYGDVFSFTSFGSLIINLGSAKAIKELHVNKSDCFAERYERFNVLTYILEGSVSCANGESWKAQRKFFIQSFKEFGLTSMRDSTAVLIYGSVENALEKINSHNGEKFDVMELLVIQCTGTMRKVLFGEDGVSDEELNAINGATAVTLEAAMGVKTLIFGPIGKILFLNLPRNKLALDSLKTVNKLLTAVVKKIETNLDVHHVTCVVEDFYKEKKLRHQKKDSTWEHFTDKALVSSLIQMIGDGIFSVAYFIGFFLHALVKHPEEQEKIYSELMEVVGPNRLPSAEDRSQLHYTNAFMTEVIRTSNFFSVFPSMECTKETTIRGYRIPKGSITMLNIWQSHHDSNEYENPYEFDPSRFLPSLTKPKLETPVEFGLGKRACTGEPYAMLQVFLYLTSIVKTFTISDPDPSKSGLFLTTGIMNLCFKPRTKN